jgi:hypothetical protein
MVLLIPSIQNIDTSFSASWLSLDDNPKFISSTIIHVAYEHLSIRNS